MRRAARRSSKGACAWAWLINSGTSTATSRSSGSSRCTAKTPIVIGESDPEGCAACGVSHYPHNGYRNGTMYPTYTALQIARTYELADRHQVNLIGAVTWAFLFEGQPYSGRLPRSGDQRHREAGPEHVPDAGADARRSRAGGQLRGSARGGDPRQGGAGGAGHLGARGPLGPLGDGPDLELPRRRCPGVLRRRFD